MKRALTIHLLTHIYPAWVVLHMVYGNWSRFSQICFNTFPLLIFGGLFTVWKNTKLKLNPKEIRSINYLIFMLFVIISYYNICVVSEPKWVYDHNNQAAGFIITTSIFYIYTYYESR